MIFEMPVLICGAMSFQPDQGNRINQLFALNEDSENPIYRGLVPSKMTCDEVVFQQLPADPTKFPIQLTLKVRNKTSGGKTVQHVVGVVQQGAKKS